MDKIKTALGYLIFIVVFVFIMINVTTDGYIVKDRLMNIVSDNANETVTENKVENISHSARVDTYVDPETGVNYLIYSDHRKGGITVRVDKNGAPIVSNR